MHETKILRQRDWHVAVGQIGGTVKKAGRPLAGKPVCRNALSGLCQWRQLRAPKSRAKTELKLKLHGLHGGVR